jgi:hypothetical protein
VLRTAKNVRCRRELNGAWWQALNPVQFLGVLGILLALDAATLIGWLQAIADDLFDNHDTADT